MTHPQPPRPVQVRFVANVLPFLAGMKKAGHVR